MILLTSGCLVLGNLTEQPEHTGRAIVWQSQERVLMRIKKELQNSHKHIKIMRIHKHGCSRLDVGPLFGILWYVAHELSQLQKISVWVQRCFGLSPLRPKSATLSPSPMQSLHAPKLRDDLVAVQKRGKSGSEWDSHQRTS